MTEVPGTSVPAPSVLVIERSAWAPPVGLVLVEVLLAGSGSVVPVGAVTVTVLSIAPVVAGGTVPVKVIVTEAPATRLTLVAMSAVPDGLEQLAAGAHDQVKAANGAGTVSATGAPVTSEGPLLVTVMV